MDILGTRSKYGGSYKKEHGKRYRKTTWRTNPTRPPPPPVSSLFDVVVVVVLAVLQDERPERKAEACTPEGNWCCAEPIVFTIRTNASSEDHGCSVCSIFLTEQNELSRLKQRCTRVVLTRGSGRVLVKIKNSLLLFTLYTILNMSHVV